MKLFMLAICMSVAFVLILLKGTQFNFEFLLARAAEYMLHVSAGTMWVASLYSASLGTYDLNSLILLFCLLAGPYSRIPVSRMAS